MRTPIARGFIAVGFAVFVAVGTAPASNQAFLYKFELSAAYAWENPRLNASYLHSYAPPFTPGTFQSSASQTLALKGRKSHGYTAALRYFPIRFAGLEVLYDAFKADLTGVNSNYKTYLKYVSRQPPDYIPIEYVIQREEPWPATEGEFKETIISVNAVARAPLAPILTVKVSAGASFCNFEAQSSSIAFTKYWLGGHGVLFMQEYRLALDWGTPKTTGYNFGGELNLDLFSNIGLAADVRYFSFPETSARWHVQTGEGVSETAETLESLMSLGPVKFNPSLFRVNLGLRFLF